MPRPDTRQAIIDTAGRLFSIYGIEELDSRAATTTRGIANAAGENTGTIHYHFGGREDLINAVIDYAIQPWKDDPLGKHVNENSHLLETRKGQIELTESLIDLLFEIIFSRGYPSWCAAFLFKYFQKKSPTSEKAFAICAKPIANAFAIIYRKATGDDSETRAQAWSFTIVAPAVFHVMDMESAALFFEDKKLPAEYLTTIKAFLKTSAKAGLEKGIAERKAK